jgi:hypothetical protein
MSEVRRAVIEFDADIDDNGVVDSADLGAVLSGWGECP